MAIEVKTDINDIYELARNTWSGGNATVEEILKLDAENGTNYGDRLMSHLEEVFMFDEETPTLTTVNDYLWFETDSIYEAIGLTSDGEIPTAVDEAREENRLWYISTENLKEIEESNLFSDEFIDYVKEDLERVEGRVEYATTTIDFEELDMHHEEPITEEQIEFLDNI